MSEPLSNDEYQCESCGRVFTKTRSDEEAMAEAVATFTPEAMAKCALVCDDCYEMITDWAKREGLIQ